MASDKGEHDIRRGDMMDNTEEDSDYDYTGEDSYNEDDDDCDTSIVREEERCRFDWQDEEDRFSGASG